jgi:hypothetical protein
MKKKSEVSSELYGENRAIKTRRKTRDTEKTVMKTIFYEQPNKREGLM